MKRNTLRHGVLAMLALLSAGSGPVPAGTERQLDFAPPIEEPPAEQVPVDAELAAGPDAIWAEDFEALPAGDRWLPNHSHAVVRASCGVGGGKCFRVSYVPQTADGESGTPGILGAQPLPPADEYTLNYDLLFENGFEWVRGGKLPGLAPASWGVGCEAIKPNEWSERGMWRSEGRFELYTYHQDRVDRCGDHDTAPDFSFPIHRWHAVSMRVKVNSAVDRADGLAELYVNGVKVAEKPNLRFRAELTDATRITRMMFVTFFGGANNSSRNLFYYPSKTVYARFDNFAVYPGLRVRPRPGQ